MEAFWPRLDPLTDDIKEMGLLQSIDEATVSEFDPLDFDTVLALPTELTKSLKSRERV